MPVNWEVFPLWPVEREPSQPHMSSRVSACSFLVALSWYRWLQHRHVEAGTQSWTPRHLIAPSPRCPPLWCSALPIPFTLVSPSSRLSPQLTRQEWGSAVSYVPETTPSCLLTQV